MSVDHSIISISDYARNPDQRPTGGASTLSGMTERADRLSSAPRELGDFSMISVTAFCCIKKPY